MRLRACVVLGAFLLVGCGDSDSNKVDITVSVPNKAKRGESIKASVIAHSDKEKGFKGIVQVKIEAPQGIKVDPQSFELDMQSKERVVKDFNIDVSSETTPGEVEMTVTCTPAGGETQVNKFKIKAE